MLSSSQANQISMFVLYACDSPDNFQHFQHELLISLFERVMQCDVK